MKRDEVEAILRRACASEHHGYLLCNVAPHRLAELCRSYLAVLDAPVVAWQLRVKATGYVRGTYADEPDAVQLEFAELDGEEYIALIERVRLLIEEENNAVR